MSNKIMSMMTAMKMKIISSNQNYGKKETQTNNSNECKRIS